MKKLITTWIIAMAQEWATAGEIRTSWPVKVRAAIIAAEARGEGLRGMWAVGEVIQNKNNRILWEDWECLRGIKMEELVSKMMKEDGWIEALAIAEKVYNVSLKSNITKGATHFHRVGKKPYWAKGKKGIKIGNHVFYKL